MTEIYNNVSNIPQNSTANVTEGVQTEAHYSSNMKVERPKVIPSQGPSVIGGKQVYSDKDANLRMKQINQDIYENSKKYRTKKSRKKSNIDKIEKNTEAAQHEFDSKTFLKIFGGLSLSAIIIAGVRKIRRK